MICFAFIALNVKRNNIRSLFRLCGPCQPSFFFFFFCFFNQLLELLELLELLVDVLVDSVLVDVVSDSVGVLSLDSVS